MVTSAVGLAPSVSSPLGLTLGELHALLGNATLVGNPALPVLRVHTDTRTLQAGDLFVALRGERYDGHQFLAQALAAGAVAVLAEEGLGPQAQGLDVPGLQVPDTLAALQRLAAQWRLGYAGPLVAVTGSNGKTTVTQMVASIFRAWQGDAALATVGNLNNHLGVPLTLLRLRPAQHRAAVLELGMNHPGEIAQLAALAAPTVAVVNNAQREHQEFMASVDAVAAENGSVISALPASGVAVLPAFDAYTPLWRSLAGTRRVLSFALQDPAGGQAGALPDVSGQARWCAAAEGGAPQAPLGQRAPNALTAPHWALELRTPQGPASTQVHLPGLHNVHNALAAAAAALAAGCPLGAVAQGLAQFSPVAGRSQLLALQRQGQAVTLVDDSYNANPDSVLAAIDVLASQPGPRWLLLGDMGEVGQQGPQFHAEVGAHARHQGIDVVWAAGALCAHAGATRWFENTAALVAALGAGQALPPAASVLVKGSRFMKMEHVVHALQQRWGHHAAQS